jgi:uncharacterized membrane protein
LGVSKPPLFFLKEKTMTTLKKTIVVNVPAEKIYNYVQDPLTALEYWPSMMDIRDIQKLPNGGSKFHWTYKMAGMRLEGTSEDTELIPNRKAVSKSTGGIDSVVTWSFEPAGGGTRVDFSVDYTIPMPVIGKLAESVIVKLNDHEATTIVANIKARLEA